MVGSKRSVNTCSAPEISPSFFSLAMSLRSPRYSSRSLEALSINASCSGDLRLAMMIFICLAVSAVASLVGLSK